MLQTFYPSIRKLILVAFMSFCGVMVLHTPALAEPSPRCKSVEIVAHRGYWNNAHTENTLKAFRRAYRNGATNLETDIRMTQDNHWVLMHDATVNRTTNGSGLVKERSLAKLKTLKTLDGTLGGIPTLEETLNFLQRHPNM